MDTDLIPDDPFPELSRALAQRYDYLTRGLIRYRKFGTGSPGQGWQLVDLKDGEDHLWALLTQTDTALPYPPDFPEIGVSANQQLTAQADLHLVAAWPQPTMYVAPDHSGEAGQHVAIGDDLATEPTDVALKRAGEAILWWNGEAEASGKSTAVIWEAVLSGLAGGGPRIGAITSGSEAIAPADHPLAEWLWSTCETFLRERGQTRLLTTRRDPAYDPDAFWAFLRRRDYHALRPGESEAEASAMWAEKTSP